MYQLGCTNWDTADVYLDSEDLIGKWSVDHSADSLDVCSPRAFRFKRTGKRNEIFLVTKFGFNMEPWAGGKTTIGDPDYVFKAVENSLSRLGVDCIDLYYLRRYI